MEDAFRDFVNARLAATGLSAAALSGRAGIDQSLFSKYLHVDPRRRVRPSPRNLEKLAPVLGLPYEDLMRMCGYLPGEPSAQIDARRQVVRDQLERWLTAVGPEHEEYFWQHLKAQGDSTVDLIRRLGTAVSGSAEAAVSAAVSGRKKRTRRAGGRDDSSLSLREHATHGLRSTAALSLGAASAA